MPRGLGYSNVVATSPAESHLVHSVRDGWASVEIPVDGRRGDLLMFQDLNPRELVNTNLWAMGNAFLQYRWLDCCVVLSGSCPTTIGGSITVGLVPDSSLRPDLIGGEAGLQFVKARAGSVTGSVTGVFEARFVVSPNNTARRWFDIGPEANEASSQLKLVVMLDTPLSSASQLSAPVHMSLTLTGRVEFFRSAVNASNPVTPPAHYAISAGGCPLQGVNLDVKEAMWPSMAKFCNAVQKTDVYLIVPPYNTQQGVLKEARYARCWSSDGTDGIVALYPDVPSADAGTGAKDDTHACGFVSGLNVFAPEDPVEFVFHHKVAPTPAPFLARRELSPLKMPGWERVGNTGRGVKRVASDAIDGPPAKVSRRESEDRSYPSTPGCDAYPLCGCDHPLIHRANCRARYGMDTTSPPLNGRVPY